MFYWHFETFFVSYSLSDTLLVSSIDESNNLFCWIKLTKGQWLWTLLTQYTLKYLNQNVLSACLTHLLLGWILFDWFFYWYRYGLIDSGNRLNIVNSSGRPLDFKWPSTVLSGRKWRKKKTTHDSIQKV